MVINSQFLDNLRISDITVISGVRMAGRMTDYSNGRSHNGILYVRQGEAAFYSGQEKIAVVSDGELLFLPKHKRYHMRYTAESTAFVLVNFELRGEGNEEALLFEDVTVLARDDAMHRLERTMKSFELCGASKTVDATLRKKELMYRLLGAVYSPEFCLPKREDVIPRIAEGVYLLEQRYLENLPIAFFAKASHVSVNTFRALFQKQFGCSPVKYRNRLRLERARELLLEGGFAVSEVAYASGFENVGYFCRAYRQSMGESPGETKQRSPASGA